MSVVEIQYMRRWVSSLASWNQTHRTLLWDWFCQITKSFTHIKLKSFGKLSVGLTRDKPQNCITAIPMSRRVHMEGFGTWQTSRISLITIIVHAFVHNAVLVVSFLGVLVKVEHFGITLLLTYLSCSLWMFSSNAFSSVCSSFLLN